MRKFLVITLVSAALSAQAQTSSTETTSTKGFLKTLDLSLNVGTTGVGFDLATPINDMFQVRVGYEFMPPFHVGIDFPVEVGGEPAEKYDANGNRIESRFDRLAKNLKEFTGYDIDSHVEMIGKPTMNNFKLLFDVFPFKNNKHWHFTAGLYIGPSQFARADNSMEAMNSLMAVSMYNHIYDRVNISWETGAPIMDISIGGQRFQPELNPDQQLTILNNGRMGFPLGRFKEDVYDANGNLIHAKGEKYVMEPGADNQVHVYAKSNVVKPYLGFGYGGRLVKGRDDWKVSFDAGVLIWGKPDLYTHDGTNLTKDVEGITGKVGDYVDFVKGLVVYPSVSVRFTKRIF